MAFIAPLDAGLKQLSQLLKEGALTSEALTAFYLDRISTHNPTLGAFITVTGEAALREAAAADQLRKAGDTRPLLGLCLAHKDLFCTAGVRTTCASKMLANFISPYDATVVRKCREAGLINLGKTNMDEFAMGSSNETSYFGAASNPWDEKRTPGGSSGGSAAAVAGALTPIATGTDTGGSIRLPAAFCGLTGIKPTYGRVSRYGMVAFASSLDQGGVIAHSAEDAALLLGCMVGQDAQDATTSAASWSNPLQKPASDLSSITIGVPKAFIEHLADESRRSFDMALGALGELGATVKEVDLPHVQHGVAAYYVIAPAEASANLSRYDGVRYGHRCENPKDLEDLYIRSRTEGFGEEVKRRILIGIYTLSIGYQDAYYRKAQTIRRLIRDSFNSALEKVDVIATPTTSEPAFLKGQIRDPVTMYQQDVFTVPASLAGLPAISLPGPLVGGLPYGLHLQAAAFKEDTLLRIGYALQQKTNWHQARPPMLEAD